MRKLIANGEGKRATKPLTAPCSDCPMRRDALPGWLGGYSADEYRMLSHSDCKVECHVHNGSRCAGMAIYRTNVCKWQPPEDKLPGDEFAVFSTPMEFMAHHDKGD